MADAMNTPLGRRSQSTCVGFCPSTLDVVIACAVICVASFVGGAGTAQAAITAAGDVNPVHTGSDPWVLAIDLKVGDTSAGTLDVDAGSSITGTNAYIGTSVGSTGAVKVAGEDSTWSNSGGLTVGLNGSGTLDIHSGGSVANTLGGIYGVQSVVTVHGEGSSWINTGKLNVGLPRNLVYPDAPSHGTLNIQAGGLVSSVGGAIGERSVDTYMHPGAVVVTGAGSMWTNSAELSVGGSGGTATLDIEDGGLVTNTNGIVSGVSATATVTGPNSTWINTGKLSIGVYKGTLNILAGGSVSSNSGYVGEGIRATGAATVSGPGSTWTNAADLYVAEGGSGTLSIEDGGVVSSLNGSIGSGSIIGFVSMGLVTVTGEGSTWANTGSVYVGGSSTHAGVKGTLDVADAGFVSVADTLKVWGPGTVRGDGFIAAGNLLNSGTVAPGNSAGVLTLTGHYSQNPDGKLEIEIAGNGDEPGVDFDRLNVTGSVALAGTLDVSLIDDASLTPGSRFDIITFTGTRSGRFNFTLLPAVPGVGLGVEYGPNAVTIVAILPGDLNGDGFVGIQDLNAVLGNWNQNVPMWDLHAGDTNGDGYVGIEDLNAVLGNWNAGTPPMDVSAAIPEPGTIGVLAIGAAWGCFRGRGRMRRG